MEIILQNAHSRTPFHHSPALDADQPTARTLEPRITPEAKASITREVDQWRERILRVLGITGQAAQVARHLANMQAGVPKAGQPYLYSTVRLGAHFSKSRDPEAHREMGSKLLRALFDELFPRAGRNPLERLKAKPGSGEANRAIDWLTVAAEKAAESFRQTGKRSEDWRNAQHLKNRVAKQKAEEAVREDYARDAINRWIPKCNALLIDEDGEIRGFVSQETAARMCAENEKWNWEPYAWEEKPKAEKPVRMWTSEDFKRAETKLVDGIADQLDEMAKQLYYDDQSFAALKTRLLPRVVKAFETQRKLNETFAEKAGHAAPLIPPSFHHPEEEFSSPPASDGGMGADWAAFDGASGLENELLFDEIPPLQNGGGTFGVEPATDCDLNDLREPAKSTLPETAPESVAADSFVDWALRCAADGWPVTPECWVDEAGKCQFEHHNRDGECDQPGKRPLFGKDAATTNRSQIRRWWRKYPHANIGLRCDGRIILDADTKAGGLMSLAAIQDEFNLPETRTATTQSGGVHAVYSVPEGFDVERLKCWIGVLPGLDLRVDTRGLILAEPSRGVKGAYRWRDYSAPIVPLPVEVCEYLIQAQADKEAREKATTTTGHYSEPAQLSSGTVARPAGSIPIPDQTRFFRDVPKGERHNRLRSIAVSMRTNYAATEEQIRAAVEHHARKFSEPFDDWGWVERTIPSICAKYPPSAKAA